MPIKKDMWNRVSKRRMGDTSAENLQERVAGLTSPKSGGQLQAASTEKENDFDLNSVFSGGEPNWGDIARQLRDYLDSMLRPNVDEAIEDRRESGKAANAELDADAASRGMESSTYVTSMKSREQDDVQDDIAGIESDYTATLSQEIYDAMFKLTEEYSEKQRFEKQLEADAQALEKELAAARENWEMRINSEETMLNKQLAAEEKALQKQLAAARRSSSVGESGEEVPVDIFAESDLGYNDYYSYLEMLDNAGRQEFFNSDALFWKMMREQLVHDIGTDGYYSLMKLFDDRRKRGGYTEMLNELY